MREKNRRRSRLSTLAASLLTLLVLSGQVLAAGGGKAATKLVNVADARALTGFARWIADIYNHSYWLFAIVTVGIMAGMGIVLGLSSDRLMAALGINLGKMKHHE